MSKAPIRQNNRCGAESTALQFHAALAEAAPQHAARDALGGAAGEASELRKWWWI